MILEYSTTRFHFENCVFRYTQGWMIWRVPTLVQFLPKYHRISMEERIPQAPELCTTCMWYSMWVNMWIDPQRARGSILSLYDWFFNDTHHEYLSPIKGFIWYDPFQFSFSGVTPGILMAISAHKNECWHGTNKWYHIFSPRSHKSKDYSNSSWDWMGLLRVRSEFASESSSFSSLLVS
jgi:hypothetical protein